jgi:hypothetical protein
MRWRIALQAETLIPAESSGPVGYVVRTLLSYIRVI